MTGWWTGQDATRAPRFDLATFSGVQCPDISFVRLPLPASSYQGGTAFGAIASAIATAGFVALFKDYLVYYDGPSVEDDICGTGGGDFNQGGGFAIVWLNGCPDVPSDAIATHELLHALGASFTESPNDCPPPNDHHPCDSSTDVLYPFRRTTPLANSCSTSTTTTTTPTTAPGDIQDSIFLDHEDTPEEALGLTISGVGSVTSDLPGVACTASCTTQRDQGPP